MTISLDGILLVYHHPLAANAPTILEHVEAFRRHSAFPVWSWNTELGFPPLLERFRFGAVVLHYSLFGLWPPELDERWLEYLSLQPGRRIAFFQDEYRFCRQRFRLIDALGIDTVYTLLEPRWFEPVYGRHTRVRRIVPTLAGYVGEPTLAAARRFGLPDERRPIDIGYRARRLDPFMGRGAQEKAGIAEGFRKRAEGLGLALDIEVGEASRIRGDDWLRFVAGCRGMPGVEAGVSIFDFDGSIQAECRRIENERPGIDFETLHARCLRPHEGNVNYRMLSPRHFEAAAFRVVQILFEGEYSGVLVPWRHYLPLKKDFSNFDEVIARFRDPAVRREVTETAYREIIASGTFGYGRFIRGFDADLAGQGLPVGRRPGGAGRALELALMVERARRAAVRRAGAAGRIRLRRIYLSMRHRPFPGRKSLKRWLGRGGGRGNA